MLCDRISNSWLVLEVLIDLCCWFVNKRTGFFIFVFNWSLWGLGFNLIPVKLKLYEIFFKLASDLLIVFYFIKEFFLTVFHWNRGDVNFIIWPKVYRFVEYLWSLWANHMWGFIPFGFNVADQGLLKVIWNRNSLLFFCLRCSETGLNVGYEKVEIGVLFLFRVSLRGC